MLYDLGPRAMHVYQSLRDRIRSGEVAPGTRLPAHTDLAATYEVAPLTIRQVLARLEADRLVVRERGRGTFVRIIGTAGDAHVLIVAANAGRREALEQQVRADGKRALVTATPAEALASLNREVRPSLAIIDLQRPTARAGLRLARGLRQRFAELPIVVLNPTRGQRSRLESSVAPPMVFAGDPPLDPLSRVLSGAVFQPGSGPPASESPLELLLERYMALQLAGERVRARALIRREGLEAGISVAELYRSVLAPAQHRVGELWQGNQIGVAREHLATAVTEAVMLDLASSATLVPDARLRVLVACVEGELHDIGARMLADLLELDGYDVRYLGADVPTDSLLNIVNEESPAVVVLSAAMAERLVALRAAVTRLRRPRAARLHILVGGQVMDWAPECVRALDVDLAAHDARETLAAVRRVLSVGEARHERVSTT